MLIFFSIFWLFTRTAVRWRIAAPTSDVFVQRKRHIYHLITERTRHWSMQVGVQLCDAHLMSDIITLKNNDDDEVTFTPSAFLLLPLFPPERGMRTKRERSSRVRKKGTKAANRRDGIVPRTSAHVPFSRRSDRSTDWRQWVTCRSKNTQTSCCRFREFPAWHMGRSVSGEAKFRTNLR